MTPAAATPATSGITVVVPTYNGGAYIGQALRSVFDQTELPTAIIVVDDCSTDDTFSVAQGLAEESPVPLRVLRMPQNTGSPARPFNAGVEAASTEFVALLEHDDLMFPRRLQLQRAALARFPDSGIAIGRVVQFTQSSDGTLNWERNPVARHPDLAELLARDPGGSVEIPARAAFRALVTNNFVHTNSNMLLRRSCWARLGGFSDSWPRNNDAEFEFRWFAQCPVAVVDEPCCGYRRSPGSLFHSNLLRSLVDGQRLRLQVLRQHPALGAGLRPAVRLVLHGYARRAWRAGAYGTALRAWRDVAWDSLQPDR